LNKLVDINRLTIAYDSKVVLENADFAIHENDFIGVIGPNGGGKTTLLKAILGLIPYTSGNIVFYDELKNHQSPIGYLPQVNKFDNRFPISVYEVILSGLANQKSWKSVFLKKDRSKVDDILSKLGIESIAHKPIGELSGGFSTNQILMSTISLKANCTRS
jgi:zinc transport system ATP-binding protein